MDAAAAAIREKSGSVIYRELGTHAVVFHINAWQFGCTV